MEQAKCTARRVVGLASVPTRKTLLIPVINSLVSQVDEIYVALNGYTEVPEELRNLRNVFCVILDNSLGDSAKFLYANIPNVIYYGADDDLVYPPGYCDYMQEGMERYDGLVSLHGRQYPKGAGFKQWTGNYRCLNTVKEDVRVNLVGSGVCCFSTNRLKISILDFKTKNMADCYLSRKAYVQDVPMVVLKHREGYLKYLHPKDTIWQQMRDYSLQSEILKSYVK